MTRKKWIHRKWWIPSILIAICIGVSIKLAYERFNRSEFASLLEQKNVSAGEVEALNLMGRLDHKTFSDEDARQLEKLSIASEEKTRVMAFSTVAHMANHGDRAKALTMLERVDSDPSPNIRKKKLWWHFVARTSDWRQLAKDGLASQDPVVVNDAKLAIQYDPDLKKK